MNIHSSLILISLRSYFYKLLLIFKRCISVFFTLLMWLKTNCLSLLVSSNRSRKVLLILIILGALILYLWPHFFSWKGSKPVFDPIEDCLSVKVQPFFDQNENFDAIIQSIPQEIGKRKYLPYVGNGYFGVPVQGASPLFFRETRSLSLAVNFYPLIYIDIKGHPMKERNVIVFKEGLVYRIQCFKLASDMCVTATTQVYAHRTRPSILVQDIRLHNPSTTTVTFDLSRIGASGWTGVTATKENLGVLDVNFVTGTIAATSDVNLVYAIAFAYASIKSRVTVDPGQSIVIHNLMAVMYSEEPVSLQFVQPNLMKFKQDLLKELELATLIDSKTLRKEHVSTWNTLWESGFSISVSRAQSALNGDIINSTIYYMLSQSRSPIHEKNTPGAHKFDLEKLLYFPDRCYDDHHTLQNEKMWLVTDTVAHINYLVKTWKITLDKHGCGSMMKAGADGVIQAMMLSIGGLKFSNDHLEFGTHPRDLHRDYHFRRVNYGNNTHVNISVEVGDNNKAVLYVALDRNDRPYYACDAGCLDSPVKLSRERAQFPVKLTQPVKPVLYVTADKMHMEELKHAIHVREIAEAPAHEDHVIALHRHGHHYGGLPVLFWVSISFLLVVFHLFLAKLLYNEYYHGQKQSAHSGFSRTKYNI